MHTHANQSREPSRRAFLLGSAAALQQRVSELARENADAQVRSSILGSRLCKMECTTRAAAVA